MDKLGNLRQKYEDIFKIYNLSFDDWFLDLKDYALDLNHNPKQINDYFLIYKVLHKKRDFSAQIGRYSDNKINFNSNYFFFRDLYYMCLLKKEIDHPSIISFIGFSPIDFKGHHMPVIITEKTLNGSLHDLLKHEREMKPQNSEWNSTKKLINIYGIAAAMAYLHSRNIIYRNLSPKNILLDQSFHPKIFNFGLSADIKENADDIELFDSYSKKSDVYSFSFIVFEIVTNEILFENKSHYQCYEFNEQIPKCFIDLIERCWAKKSADRPTFDEIMDELVSPRFVDILETEQQKREYFDYVCSFQSKIQTSRFLDIRNYQIINEITHYDQYNLYKIKEKSTGMLFMAKSFATKNSYNYNKQMNIVALRTKLVYPSVLRYIGYSPFNTSQEQNLTIINELINDSLKNVLELEKQRKSPSEWNLTKKLINIYGIASGMKYLHSKDIIHRNLTTNSILEDENYYPKISGFDNLIKLKDKTHKETGVIIGYPQYFAPEVIMKSKYSKSSDVYSFGILLYEVMTNETAFEDQTTAYEIYEKVVKGQRPKIDQRIPRIYQELIERCWSDNPRSRPTFSDIVEYIRNKAELNIPDMDMNMDMNKEEYSQYIEYHYLQNKLKYDKIYQQNKLINNLEIEEYSTESKVHDNSEYEIHKIRNKTTNKIYMAKIMGKEIEEFLEKEENLLFHDIDVMSKLNHPSIPKIIGLSHFDFNKRWRPVIITEMVPCGTIKDFIDQMVIGKQLNSLWTLTHKLINIFGIASSMKYLHSKNIIHNSLSPEKIFLDESLYPKLFDFRRSIVFPEADNIYDIGLFYEIENLKKHDVYDFAFVVYKIMTLKDKKRFKYYSRNLWPNSSISIPECCKNLIQQCWSTEQSDRPTFDDIVSKLKTDEFIEILDSECEKKEYLNYIISIESKYQSSKDFINIQKDEITDQLLQIQKKSTGELFIAKPFKDKNAEKLKSKLIKLDEILSKIDHPSILKYICYIQFDYANEKYSSIINENAKDNLKNVLELEKQRKSPSEWNLTKKLINIYGIASGMKYLHSKDIIHRNLTTNSILEDENYYPKISGLDDLIKLKDKTHKETKEIVGYPQYLAPEVITKSEYSKSSDVYSFGILLYEVMTNETAFEDQTTAYEIYEKVVKGQRPTIDQRIPRIYQELIERCWSDNPRSRPTFSDIVEYIINKAELNIPDMDMNMKVNKEEYSQYIEYHYLQNKLKYDKIYQQNKLINNLEIEEYSTESKVHDNSEYEIHKIRNKTTNKIYMAKIMKKGFEELSVEKYEKQITLVEMLSDFDHPSILKYVGYSLFNFIYDPNFTIITECWQDSLDKIIELEKQEKSPSEWNLTKKLINIYGIASGMKYLHSKDIIHRNLTSTNILEDENYYPKISGFDYISNTSESQNKIFGCSKYTAPEVIERKEYSKFSDVFAFSIIAKEITTNDLLVPKCIKKLIKLCMLSDPLKRPTFDMIVSTLDENEDVIAKVVDSYEYKEYVNIFKQQIEKIDDIFYQQFDEITYVDINNYEKLDRIGRGAFNNVFRVKEKGTDKMFAAKINSNENDMTEEQNAHLIREVKIMFKLNHPTIIKIYGFSPVNFNHKSRPTLILELGEGTLRDVLELENKGTSPEQWDSTKKHINIYGIALGMKYVHSFNIVHRDLKPENILEDDYLFPKITDFGLSKVLHKDSKNQSFESDNGLKGTVLYMSPEMIKSGIYSKAGDVYSFGIMVYEIIAGETPFKDMNKPQIMNSIMNGEKLKFNSTIPDCYKNLIEKCVSADIKKRPQFSQIVDLLKTEEFLNESIDESAFWNYVDYSDNYNNNDDHNDKDESALINLKFEKIETQLKVKKVITDLVVSPDVQIIDLSKFEKQDKIGSGGFAKVYKAVDKSTNEIFAAKILKDEITDLEEKDQINLIRELEILSKIDHMSIVKFIGYSQNNFKNKPRPVIVSEIVSNGPLSGILDLESRGCKVEGWNDTKKLINIYGIASALKYLHSKSFIHRDIKLENILVDEHLFPKISDFGLAKVYSEKICEKNSNILGTPRYIAPEIWRCYEYSKASDVYSFGLIVFEIMTNERAFSEIKYQDKLCYEVAINNYRPKFKIQIPQCYKELIEICWSPNPYDRPSFERIIDIIRTDPDFITDSVEFEEFVSYTKYINESYTQENDEKQNGSKSLNNEYKTYSVPRVKETIDEHTIKTFNNVIGTIVANHSIRDFLLDLSNYEIKKLIRKGEFSKVFEVVHKSTGKSYSARLSNIDMSQFRKEEMNVISFDFDLISKLNHPSILSFVGFSPLSFKNEPKPVIITELSSSKTLEDILKMDRQNLQIPEWNETKKLINIYGIASAMRYMHSNNIIHRNLNPSSIIMNEKLHPKLSDFGLFNHLLMMNSIALQTTSRTERSSVYSAPEIILTEECTKASDVYSFSMILYEIVTKEKPFVNTDFFNGIGNASKFVNKIKRPEFKSSIPDCYKNLIESCWSEKPEMRPSFNMIVDYLEKDTEFITAEVNQKEYLEYIQNGK